MPDSQATETGEMLTPAERGGAGDGERQVTYCIVPAELAPQLHDTLRRHFRDEPSVEVIVERRFRERRKGDGRRSGIEDSPSVEERRQIKGDGGRRVGDRRAPAVPAEAPPSLPRRARRYAAELHFVRRLEPEGDRAEDLDTGRLVSRIQAGERHEFGKLYTRYFDRIYGYLRMLIRDSHEAEDLTQQVFVDLMVALPRYERREQPFRAWLFTVVRNRARMHMRTQRRVEVADPFELEQARETVGAAGAEPGAPEAEESLADLESLSWIADRDLLLFVERLPDQQRQVLTMRYLLDLPAGEIAEALGSTPDAVRALQYRAAQTLRDRLAAIGRGPEAGRGDRAPMKAGIRQAPVLRNRRWALYD